MYILRRLVSSFKQSSTQTPLPLYPINLSVARSGLPFNLSLKMK